MLVNVTVGTPGQPSTMGLVTWWGDTQITNGTDIWTWTGFGDPCTRASRKEFNPEMLTSAIVFPSDSSTFNILEGTQFNDTIGEGPGHWYSGEYAQDTLNVDGNTFEDFTFAVMEKGAEYGDNMIGLGANVDETLVQVGGVYTTPDNTFLTYLVSKGLIQTTAFSLFVDDPTESLPTGKLLLGGVDAGKAEGGLETLSTTITTGSKTNESTYDNALTVSLESLSFSPGGNLSNQKALADFQPLQVHPGTYSTWLPPDAATSLWRALGATYDTTIEPKKAIPIVPCSYLLNSTTLNFHFGSTVTIPVPISDLTIHNGTGLNNADGPYADACTLDIFAIDPTVSFNSIGTAVLKHMYIVYDLQNNQISIGSRSGSASNILEIGTAGVSALGLSPSPTPTSTSSPSPTPGPKKSDALAIGLGVGLSLGLILVIGLIAGWFFLRRRRRRQRANAVPTPISGSAMEENGSYNSQAGIAYEKVPADAPTDNTMASTLTPTHQSPELYQGTFLSPTESTQVQELPGATVRYSELSGISAFMPHSPISNASQSPTQSPRPAPYEGT